MERSSLPTLSATMTIAMNSNTKESASPKKASFIIQTNMRMRWNKDKNNHCSIVGMTMTINVNMNLTWFLSCSNRILPCYHHQFEHLGPILAIEIDLEQLCSKYILVFKPVLNIKKYQNPYIHIPASLWDFASFLATEFGRTVIIGGRFKWNFCQSWSMWKWEYPICLHLEKELELMPSALLSANMIIGLLGHTTF